MGRLGSGITLAGALGGRFGGAAGLALCWVGILTLGAMVVAVGQRKVTAEALSERSWAENHPKINCWIQNPTVLQKKCSKMVLV